MAKFQCLRTLVAELSSLENRLFLANVTMPSLFHRRHEQLKPDIPSEINSRSPCCGTTRAKTLTLMLMIRSNRHGAMARSSKSLLGLSHVHTNSSRLTHLLITRSQGLRGIIWYTRGTHVMNKNCYCQAFLVIGTHSARSRDSFDTDAVEPVIGRDKSLGA